MALRIKQKRGVVCVADRVAAHVARRSAVTRLKCQDPKRRARLEKNPAKWLKWYMASTYPRPWDKPHLVILKGIMDASNNLERLCIAAERGLGKSAVMGGAMLMLKLTGRQIFPVIICYEKKTQKQTFKLWRNALCFNPRLLADYPEYCAPFAHSRGVPQRVNSATWADTGLPTQAQLTVGEGLIVFADGLGCIGGGTIGGNSRGLNNPLPDGRLLRPSFAGIDDVQSRTVARSSDQCDLVIKIIDGDIAGLGEAGKSLPMVMSLNCIEPGDVPAHYMLEPDWQSIRISCIEAFPIGFEDSRSECAKMWKEWHERCQDKESPAKFFRKHRKTMLAGMVISAPNTYKKRGGNLPPEYYVMAEYYRMGDTAFRAERNQMPIKPSSSTYELTPAMILSRKSGFNRLFAPAGSVVVMAVDINYVGLNWTCMVGDSLTTSRRVVAHGIWTNGHGDMIPKGVTDDQACNLIRKYLGMFISQIVNPMRINCGGEIKRIYCCCFDASMGRWQESTIAALREAKSQTRLWALKAFGHNKYRVRRDDLRQGKGWRVAQWPGLGNVIVIDADYWRRNMQQGFLVEPTEAGAISLYEGGRGENKELAVQIAGEKLDEYVTTAINEFYKWTRTPGVPNDRADATYYACALLAMQGIGEPLQRRSGGRSKRRKVRHTRV